MVSKTAPCKERASWEIREARVFSFDDIAVVVSTCGDESADGLEVTIGGD
ncbi:hypothetical protein RchiOBHm_Chr6g0284921 [Rosa chinensis]|uniref:Uncharacterized protein n=1 Tax=Rosa chinensis TaxID=74649 RepID=A0A2P6PUG2_ROSCH|nr:hypothetical protein RchiOBHm_Chr6g0284921 [Rosa chinensis]